MSKYKKWLVPIATVCLLLATLIGCSGVPASSDGAPASLGEIFDPSGNPFANRFSDVKDIRTATYVVAASDSEHKYEADYFCNGTNDDVEINAALAAGAGGKVTLLEGNYQITENLIVPADTHFAGMAKGTILTTTDAIAITNMVVVNGNNVTVSDMKLVLGAGAGAPGTRPNCIYAAGRTNLLLETLWLVGDLTVDCETSNVKQCGICFVNTTYSWIALCRSENNKQNSISLNTNSDFNTISENICQGNYAMGIFLSGSSNNTLSGNICKANESHGIRIDYGSNYNTVTGNICQGNIYDSSGIFVDISKYNVFTSNTLLENGGYGLYLDAAYDNIITGNNCQGNETAGIFLTDSWRNAITGNNCQANKGRGIYLTAASYNTVTGNTCQRNYYYGISLGGSHHNTISGNTCTENSQDESDGYDNIYISGSDYNLITGNVCRAPTVGTTLTVGEPAGEDDIAVTDTAGFEIGMRVVIDLGGGNVEYHHISAITPGAPGVITIATVLVNNQGAGETIDVPEARYGINVRNEGSDKNIIQGSDLYESGKTANFNDVGTLTIVQDDNRGITPVQVKHLVYVQNTSGGNLLTGNVVAYEAAAGTVGFHSPTAIGDPMVWGMLAEDIDDNAFGYIQVLGGTTVMDATNVGGGAIAIGDLLCTEVGSRARKVGAASDHVAFAIALEALDAADGIIDALLITPRNTP